MKTRSFLKKGAGILILLLTFFILLTVLFILNEIKRKTFPQKPHEQILHRYIPQAEKKSTPEIDLKKFGSIGKIVLIVDDVGWNPDIVARVRKINIPLTLAILPDSPFGLRIAQQISKDKKIDAILHIPLEPENSGYETNISHAYITTDMSDSEIREKVNQYIEKFRPYISGINNHMGSKFTADKQKMEVLLQEIKGKKLTYIDSLTSTKSVGYRLSKQMGIPALKRDIFIDNSSDYLEIWKNLEAAAKMSETKSTVIAIGHARPTTLKVIEEKIPELISQGYQFVLIKEVIQ